MKLKIKYKKLSNVIDSPSIIANGDWVDLRCSKEVIINPFIKQSKSTAVIGSNIFYIPTGLAFKLPKGFEAHIVARSSTPTKYGFIVPNCTGIIDNSFCGNTDEWKIPSLGFNANTIPANTRIAQFKIELSQKATVWQKLKWLLSSGIELVEVTDLASTNRGGFGSTGEK